LITDKLISLIKKRSLLGPYNINSSEADNILCSPIFPIVSTLPNGDIKKVRIVHNLSYKRGTKLSINDAIDPALCTVSYTGLLYVARMAIIAGTSGKLWSVDQPSAYHSCRITTN